MNQDASDDDGAKSLSFSQMDSHQKKLFQIQQFQKNLNQDKPFFENIEEQCPIINEASEREEESLLSKDLRDDGSKSN